MTLQKDNPDKLTEALELAARQRAVTVPEDKLIELLRKAKLVDDLVKVLEEVDEALYCASEWIVPIMLPTRVKEAIAKAKEQSCSTLCHPEEECFITESGKCEAKEE